MFADPTIPTPYSQLGSVQYPTTTYGAPSYVGPFGALLPNNNDSLVSVENEFIEPPPGQGVLMKKI